MLTLQPPCSTDDRALAIPPADMYLYIYIYIERKRAQVYRLIFLDSPLQRKTTFHRIR